MNLMTKHSILATKLAVGLLTCFLVLHSPLGVSATNGVLEKAEPHPTLRLISKTQYLNTVQAVFGSQIELNVRFAPVRRVDGMVTLGAAQAMVTPGALDALDRAAHLVAAQVLAPSYRQFIMPCQPTSNTDRDDACAHRFFAESGRFLYRRPLTNAELSTLVNVAGLGVGRAGNFYDGLERALVGMLLSPHFLFIQERVEPDPNRPGQWRFDAHSKATRLSLMMWASGPDAELLTASETGSLHTRTGFVTQLERMLASPRLTQGVRAFFSDFLVLETFDNLTKDSVIFPAFTTKALEDAREQQLQQVVDHLLGRQADYRDLFTTARTMLTSNLAGLYGIPVNAQASQWVAHEFSPKDQRAGFLTQIGFLAQHAHPGRSSPTLRGKALREIMLCQPVPPPPPNVDFSLLDDTHGILHTARERLEVHNTERTCRGCHAITDPIGLGLENFNGAGQFRLTENGVLIDPAGNLDQVGFTTAIELGQAVRDNPALTSCFLKRVYTAGVGRPLITAEKTKVINPILSQLNRDGYRWKDVLRAVALSDGFLHVTAPTMPAQSSAKLAHQTEE